MIQLHKLKGQVVWVNPDLIAFMEKGHGGPDVTLTLVDGRHITVSDPPETVVQAITAHRAGVLALAFRLDSGEVALDALGAADDGPPLRAVPDPET